MGSAPDAFLNNRNNLLQLAVSFQATADRLQNEESPAIDAR